MGREYNATGTGMGMGTLTGTGRATGMATGMGMGYGHGEPRPLSASRCVYRFVRHDAVRIARTHDFRWAALPLPVTPPCP